MTTFTTFKLVIGTDNAAFEPQPTTEIVRILREVANKIEREEQDLFPSRTVYDVNGNDVGRYSHKGAEYDWPSQY